MNEIERGALVVKGFYGILGRLRPYIAGLMALLLIQSTLVILRALGYFALSLPVLAFTLFAMAFESVILMMAFQKVRRGITPHARMIWTGELDWDLYENGILTKNTSPDGPGTVEKVFVPFGKMARVFFFPRGQGIQEVLELHRDKMRYRDDERPAGAGAPTPETASVIRDRIWFVDGNGRLMDLAMVKGHFRGRMADRFRELLRDKVKVVE